MVLIAAIGRIGAFSGMQDIVKKSYLNPFNGLSLIHGGIAKIVVPPSKRDDDEVLKPLKLLA